MKVLKSCITILLVALLLVTHALAEADGTVDIEALKAIEQSDDFPLIITNKQIERDAVLSIEGNDLLQLTIQNNSDKATRSISLYLIAYDQDCKQYKLGFFDIGQHPQSFGGDIRINSGTDQTISIHCKADTIAGVRAIISSYVDADGITHDNPNADSWCDQAYVGQKKERRTFD